MDRTGRLPRAALRTWLGAALAAAPASAWEDWPRFGGLQGDNTSPETGLVKEFGAGGPEVLWTVEVGPGYGGPAVCDGEVYVLDRVTGESDVLRCLDLDTGEEEWQVAYEAPGRLNFPGSRTVPTVEEDLVYTVGGFGHVYCFDRESHDVVWSIDVATEYSADPPGFGWAQLPLVYEDLVIVAPLTEEVGLLALDRFTGDERWHTEDLGTSHSTPILRAVDGVPQVLFVSTSAAPGPRRGQGSTGEPQGTLSSFDPETGEVLWTSHAYTNTLPIPAPTLVDPTHLFVTGGYEAGSVYLEVKQGEDGFQVDEVFRIGRGSQVHLPILVDGHLYFLANENDNHPDARRGEGGLLCLDLQGKELWRTGKDPFFGRGGMILADGVFWILDGTNGVLRVVEPSPEGYRQVAEADCFGLDDRTDHQLWAPLALSDGRLIVRSQELMKCLDLRRGAGS